MGSMSVSRTEGFTVEDLDRLPRIEGAIHELVDGAYEISRPRRPLTYQDLVDLPDVPGVGLRELLDGVIVVSPSPTPRHQGFALRLVLKLHAMIDPALRVRFAPYDVTLSGSATIQPDVLVVRPQPPESIRHEGSPLLAVEVLSPSSKKRDRVTKRRLLAEAGCPSYWIVDPAFPPTVTVLELVDGAYVEVAHVTGAESWTATQPFAVTIVPDELVDD